MLKHSDASVNRFSNVFFNAGTGDGPQGGLKSTAHERSRVGGGRSTIVCQYLPNPPSDVVRPTPIGSGMNANTFPIVPDYLILGVLIFLMAWAATHLYLKGKL
jgi:hypothetical protein